MPRELAAITFDFWDTLVVARMTHMRELRAEALFALLQDAGANADLEMVGTSIDGAFDGFKQAWAANRQFGAAEAVDHVLTGLGADVPPAVRQEMVGAIQGGDPQCDLTPNIADTLRALRSAGLRLGIICDVGWSPSTLLRGHLERHGILELFDHWSFSDDVGHYKPAPAIFAHAHAGLGVTDPSAAAHIGDLRRTDIRGALEVGATAIRYTGAFDDTSDGPEAHHVIADHADLPGVLGLVRA